MTRGRKPLIALAEAEVIGRTRGRVLPTPGRREDHFDLILFTELLTTFIRVKRSITHISDPQEILAMYRREIIRLRMVSLTTVIARELWVRSPRGSWQFFRLADRIVEIRRDGTIIEGVDHSLAVLEPEVKVVRAVVSPELPVGKV
ncbi:MAG: hypothetical protein Q7V05_02430 [Methanoregula sp.]|nr:hypothetical protein [Methanoregula sp.]